MCLIVHKVPTAKITREQVKDFHKKNSDGWGVAVRTTGGTKIIRDFGERKLWDCLSLYKTAELAVHLRMATHGVIDYSNIHPYHILEDVYLMHNGVVSVNEEDKTKSDTWHLVNLILKPLALMNNNPRDFLLSDVVKDALHRIGDGTTNKWLISSNDGLAIIKAENWIEHNGLLLSNTYAWSAPGNKVVSMRYNYNNFDNNFETFPGNSCKAPDIIRKASLQDYGLDPVDEDEYEAQELNDLFYQVSDGSIDSIRELIYNDPEGAVRLLKNLL